MTNSQYYYTSRTALHSNCGLAARTTWTHRCSTAIAAVDDRCSTSQQRTTRRRTTLAPSAVFNPTRTGRKQRTRTRTTKMTMKRKTNSNCYTLTAGVARARALKNLYGSRRPNTFLVSTSSEIFRAHAADPDPDHRHRRAVGACRDGRDRPGHARGSSGSGLGRPHHDRRPTAYALMVMVKVSSAASRCQLRVRARAAGRDLLPRRAQPLRQLTHVSFQPKFRATGRGASIHLHPVCYSLSFSTN